MSGAGRTRAAVRRRLPLLAGGLGIVVVAIAVGLAPRTSTIDGVVVNVRAASLAEVESFTLRTADGTLLEFGLEALQNGVEFPPGHLAEHVASGAPVVVTYRDEGGRHLAVRIVDKVVPSPT